MSLSRILEQFTQVAANLTVLLSNIALASRCSSGGRACVTSSVARLCTTTSGMSSSAAVKFPTQCKSIDNRLPCDLISEMPM